MPRNSAVNANDVLLHSSYANSPSANARPQTNYTPLLQKVIGYFCAQHTCSPPFLEASDWTQISAVDFQLRSLVSDPFGLYRCPECDQCWAIAAGVDGEERDGGAGD